MHPPSALERVQYNPPAPFALQQSSLLQGYIGRLSFSVPGLSISRISHFYQHQPSATILPFLSPASGSRPSAMRLVSPGSLLSVALVMASSALILGHGIAVMQGIGAPGSYRAHLSD
ncbi:hypothetical protein IF1G_11219 [Cordyceps javanica]|uniref:Uncharacterized protein n=1 Tax=Cordyceps javanica TaxID=43265 RepID=A0A545UKX4_9HYPO|nr:hypothetical protein IF1G_11219 [Cordyceps javanica]TQW01603.1 hypothetical protein IF2G_10867 [Cordyceps javanica]